MSTVLLADEADWVGFRVLARDHLLRGTPPDALQWRVRGGDAGLFDDDGLPQGEQGAAEVSSLPLVHPTEPSRAATAPTVSKAFMTLAESVILHSDAARFDLIYRLLWRMQREPGLRHDPLDAQIMQAQAMARVVHRDMHKMKAFVRFRPIVRSGDDTLHVAWFEPEHHIVAATAPFFRDRFTAMHWAILTPEKCVRWDGRTLTFGPGASRDDAPPADAGESLWLTYYAHIFNPARLKMNMMRKEMPRKYWHNLPEASLIGQLAHDATMRTANMIDAPATVPARRIVPIASLAVPAEDSGIGDLASGKRRVQSCRDCAIGHHATQAVWGEGPDQARLMVVGEQPGDQEDLRGRPFVGPAGQLFDRALVELGWARSELYVTNAVKHFKFEPRGKKRIHKTPAQQEAAACAKWLDLEVSQVRPQGIIALGATAARALLGRAIVVTHFRGQWIDGPNGIPVLITLHPSALLRMDPAVRADAWQAWLRDLAQAQTLAPVSPHPAHVHAGV